MRIRMGISTARAMRNFYLKCLTSRSSESLSELSSCYGLYVADGKPNSCSFAMISRKGVPSILCETLTLFGKKLVST